MQDIQLSLRNAIHVVRRLRISPRLLSENPPSSSVLRGGDSATTGMAAGALSHARNDTGEGEGKGRGGEAQPDPLGRGAKRMETETWRDVVDALTSMLPVPVPLPAPEPSSDTMEQTGGLRAGVGKQEDNESNTPVS